jgi:hypothetical protein
VTNGVEQGPFEALAGNLIFSPDGQHHAYLAKQEGRYLVMRDGKQEVTLLHGNEWTLAFSPDSRNLVYSGRTDVDKNSSVRAKYRAFNTGMGFATAEWIGSFRFSSSGKQLAYCVMNGDKWSWVVNGRQDKYYDSLSGQFEFSPDSRRCAYSARMGDKWYMVIDGREFGPFESIGGSAGKLEWDTGPPFAFSPDGARIAFIAKTANQYCVVEGGIEGSKYDFLTNVSFSPDSKHVLYCAAKADQSIISVHPSGMSVFPLFVVVVDGMEYAPEGEAGVVGGKAVFDSNERFHYLAFSNGSGGRVVEKEIR